MAKRIFLSAMAIVVLLGVAAYGAWAAGAASQLGDGWAGLDMAWPYLLAGVLTVGAAIAVFLSVAFYSESHGFDEPAKAPARRTGQRPRS